MILIDKKNNSFIKTEAHILNLKHTNKLKKQLTALLNNKSLSEKVLWHISVLSAF